MKPPPTRTASMSVNILTFDLVFFHLDEDLFASELVYPFAFSHEHDFKSLSVRVVVDEVSQLLVDRVVLDRDVNCYLALQINDV